MTYPMMSTMGVGRGIVFPNDSVWRYQPPAASRMIELWTGNSGLTVPPPMMRTGVYATEPDGSVWEYVPTAPGGTTQLFNGQYLPTVSGISPSSGQVGTSVTITGTGFTGATAVKFGSANAASFVVNSDTSITAVSPAVSGTAAVTVTTPNGTSIATGASQFAGLITPTSWNNADKFNITLSNANLTATATSLAGIRGVAGVSSGKHYFETLMTTWNQIGTGIGIALSTAILNGGINVAGAMGTNDTGHIYINGSDQGLFLGPRSNGDMIGIAVDLGASLLWCRICPSGNWNGSGAANPATGAGGLSFSMITGAFFPFFVTNTGGEACTANFGASAFSGTVPSGFTAGWG